MLKMLDLRYATYKLIISRILILKVNVHDIFSLLLEGYYSV